MRIENNRILGGLPADALARLAPHLQRRALRLRDLIEPKGEVPGHLFFPLNGIISVVSGPVGHEIEVGVIGRFEMTGAWALLGTASTSSSSFVQIEGTAVSIAWEELSRAMDEFPAIRVACLHGVALFLQQAIETAWSNARATLAERAARWILLCSERMDTDTLDMTHEFLSLMLGVRRPGVTLALQTLEGAGVIRNTRGRILVRDARLLAEIGGVSTRS